MNNETTTQKEKTTQELTEQQERILWNAWTQVHPAFRADILADHPQDENETAKEYAVRYFTKVCQVTFNKFGLPVEPTRRLK